MKISSKEDIEDVLEANGILRPDAANYHASDIKRYFDDLVQYQKKVGLLEEMGLNGTLTKRKTIKIEELLREAQKK